jgi:5-methyltetrahydropteroyltriglutamate--homocysteine methyltransferase
VTILRADHVGSLLRPGSLLAARAARAEGRLPDEELRQAEESAIEMALARQRAVGLEIYSDGELRRGSWITDMAEATDGFVADSRILEWHGPGGGMEASTSHVVGAPLRSRRRLTALETGFLLAHAPGPAKMTLPAPSNFYVVSWKKGVTDQAYASRSEMLADVVAILRSEVEWLIAQGVAYIQLDAPFYGSFLDEGERRRLEEAGLDPERGLAEAAAADHVCLAGLAQEGLTLALHICRGNSRSRWLTDGTYDAIAEAVFSTVGADRFLLEYDAPRHGGFEPLRFVPPGKVAVLGLVTTKAPELEEPEELLRRIDDAARVLPGDQLALSPQCGFASVAAGNLITEEDQWRKLALVVETANAAWG